MKKTRQPRSVVLSPIKVRAFLAERNIYSLRNFETDYTSKKGDERGARLGAPKQAWHGEKIDSTKALDVACYLGLDSYSPLMPDSRSLWEELINDPAKHCAFMRVHAEDPGQLGLLNFSNCFDHEPEPNMTHRMTERLHLNLLGNIGDHYFILFKTRDKFEIIAPKQCTNCINRNHGEILRYPQNNGFLAFNPQEGIGFREFIAIRIPQRIPFSPASTQIGNIISREELNRFAAGVKMDSRIRESIAVSRYAFMLIN